MGDTLADPEIVCVLVSETEPVTVPIDDRDADFVALAEMDDVNDALTLRLLDRSCEVDGSDVL